ncbi:hypothetical protein ABPG72_001182 [Tetrahymena utriculariae]
MFQPTGIIKMTNVAFIKYKINNKKFEIACYKNKAINWRNGVEKDIGEVLQFEEIYTNASHGTIAKKQDLQTYFGDMKKIDIIKLILEKGELQVGEKEREVQLNSLQNDIINIVCEKCVHPDSQRKFSVDQIQKAIKSINFKIKPDQPAKKQALECIRLLCKKFYLQRAEMLISINLPSIDKNNLLSYFKELEIEEQSIKKTVNKDKNRVELVVSIEPSKFRSISTIAKEELKDCIIEVISNVITNDQTQEIEQAGSVNLTIREDWKDDEADQDKKKDKKDKKKEGKNEDKEQKNESDDDEEESKFDEFDDDKGKKKKKKKKNPQLDLRMQQEKEKEFAAQQQKLEELNRAKLQLLEQEEKQKKPQPIANSNAKTEETAHKGSKKCTSCKEAYFETNEEYRAHFKSDWHVFNVKRKAVQEAILSEIEYKTHMLDINFQ